VLEFPLKTRGFKGTIIRLEDKALGTGSKSVGQGIRDRLQIVVFGQAAMCFRGEEGTGFNKRRCLGEVDFLATQM
jgi:hypothetical protein